MYLKTNKIIQSRDLAFVKDIRSYLDIRTSKWKNEVPIVARMDKCYKLVLINLCGNIEDDEYKWEIIKLQLKMQKKDQQTKHICQQFCLTTFVMMENNQV